MAQYNLLKDCYVNTLTVSGTGNLSLTQTDILTLYDSNTSSSGIDLLSTDILHLEVSLYKRTRLDAINVYMDVLGDRAAVLNNIDFYYKNTDSEEYLLLDKLVDDDKFYIANNFNILAPKLVKITVSGIEASLYGVELLNYDYNITFGEDGNMTEKTLYEGDLYTTIPIYNNSTGSLPATVYAAIDPASGDMCEYVKIAASSDGDYVGISDASIGISTGQSFTYTFKMGTFYNTAASDDGSKVSFMDDTNIETNYYNTAIIPITQVAYAGWGVGQNSWDYTSDGVVYTIALTSDTTSLYLLRLNNTTEEWYVCGLINTLGYVPDRNASMVILGDYLYIILNLAGNFGRIAINDPTLALEMLPTCPHGALSEKIVQGMCSDRGNYIYSAAISSNDLVDGVFVRYDVASGSWGILNSTFGENNGSSYVNPSRLVLAYDIERSLIYMDCGEFNNNQDFSGFQAYNVFTDSWIISWRAHTYYYGHAFSYYADYLVYCGYGHAFSITVLNIRTGYTTNLTLPYTQDVYELGASYSASAQKSRILCYPKADGRVGVMTAGGPYQKVYYFNLGRDMTIDAVGKYITPVLDMGDQAAAAFFYADRTCPVGTSLTFGGIGTYDTMMVRGFDTPPIPFGKLYFVYKPTTSVFALQERGIDDKTTSSTVTFNSAVAPWNENPTYRAIKRVLFDSFNYHLIFYGYGTDNAGIGKFYRYNLETSLLEAYSGGLTSYKLTTTESYVRYLSIDALGNTWIYNGATLYVLNASFVSTTLSSLNSGAADYIHTISCSKITSHCWYSNKSSKTLECTDTLGNKVLSINMSNPTFICALVDGGCSVVDDGAKTISRYSSSGILVATCDISASYNIIDFKEVISGGEVMSYWILLSNGTLLRIFEDGSVIGGLVLPQAVAITSELFGVIAYATSIKVTYQINNDCELVYTWDDSAYETAAIIGASVYIPYYTLASEQRNYFINSINDSVWGESVDNWIEVKIDNTYFGGKKYYQMKFKFSAIQDVESPTLNKLYFSKAVKISDIYPGEYKDVYVKTYFPDLYEEKISSVDLRCWWTRRDG